jgi:DNA-binding FrmR family transcriptional regulator
MGYSVDLFSPHQEKPVAHLHDAERKKALVLRLKRIEGQLRGLQRLIEDDTDCEKVAQQMAAARKALDKTFFSLVGCVIAQGDVPPDEVAELLSKFA